MGLFGQPMKQTENLTHLSQVFVPPRNMGLGLCGQPMKQTECLNYARCFHSLSSAENYTEKCLNYARCFYALSSAEDYEASGLYL